MIDTVFAEKCSLQTEPIRNFLVRLWCSLLIPSQMRLAKIVSVAYVTLYFIQRSTVKCGTKVTLEKYPQEGVKT